MLGRGTKLTVRGEGPMSGSRESIDAARYQSDRLSRQRVFTLPLVQSGKVLGEKLSAYLEAAQGTRVPVRAVIEPCVQAAHCTRPPQSRF